MENFSLDNFDWGNSSEWYKSIVGDEIFHRKIYEKFFTVQENDTVLDVGASIGVFTYSILEKNPKHVFCIEPSSNQFVTLNKNTLRGNVTCINKAISSEIGVSNNIEAYNDNVPQHYTITFDKFIENYNIQKIDFLKTDCEGGEYDIFNIKNLFWIKQNVKKIAGEFHIGVQYGVDYTEQFKRFRDVYLRVFDNFHITSIDGVDIKWELWTENFTNYYKQVLIYIDNR
jgi:FkbM family methyltransferase